MCVFVVVLLLLIFMKGYHSLEKKECKRNFRKSCRVESAKRQSEEKLKIIKTRTRDSRLFHKLVNKQRGHGRNFIVDLQVGDTTFNGENQVLQGISERFYER